MCCSNEFYHLFAICLKWEFNIYLNLLLFSCAYGYEELQYIPETAFHPLLSDFHGLWRWFHVLCHYVLSVAALVGDRCWGVAMRAKFHRRLTRNHRWTFEFDKNFRFNIVNGRIKPWNYSSKKFELKLKPQALVTQWPDWLTLRPTRPSHQLWRTTCSQSK